MLDVGVKGLFNMGRGVGYTLDAGDLQELRQPIVDRFGDRLSAQDAAPWRNPHITIQNKVSPEVAGHLTRHLRHRFRSCTLRVCGLRVWRYDQGPWTLLAGFDFSGGSHFEQGARQGLSASEQERKAVMQREGV